jgi:hypothetical protein
MWRLKFISVSMKSPVLLMIRNLLSAFAAFLPVQAQDTLDQLGLGASTPGVSAYSIRKLSSRYTGPALMTRRDSDNSDQDIPIQVVAI